MAIAYGDPAHLRVSIGSQRLELVEDGAVVREYQVSTAANGPGEILDTGCTPRGRHAIVAKIGADAPAGSVFVGRQPTGEIYSPELKAECPDRDWILTRILWLGGLEPGFNQGGRMDTQERYIYIHGCPDEVALGEPGSAGCIRMRNADVIELFDLVAEGTPVEIQE